MSNFKLELEAAISMAKESGQIMEMEKSLDFVQNRQHLTLCIQ